MVHIIFFLHFIRFTTEKTKKEGTLLMRAPSFMILFPIYPYGRLIASEGHTSAHVPHSVQASGLIEYLSPSEIAPTGHSSIHVPHAIQSSPIT